MKQRRAASRLGLREASPRRAAAPPRNAGALGSAGAPSLASLPPDVFRAVVDALATALVAEIQSGGSLAG